MTEVTNSKNPHWHVSQADHFKSLFDYLKHVSTLSTGSLLLVTTFLEKFFKDPLYSWCVGLAVGALLLSLIASLAAYSVMVLNFPRNDREFSKASLSAGEKAVFAGGILVTWFAFLVGVGTLAFFFLANWYAQHPSGT